MSQPDSGEYSVRSLAEILREHGLETELGTRPGRRRRTSDDPEVTGRSPRVEPAPRPARPQGPAATPAPARTSTPGRTAAAAPAGGRAPAAASSSAAAARVPMTTYPDPSAGSSRPAAGLAGPAAPVRSPVAAPAEPSAREPRVPLEERVSTTGRVGDRVEAAPPPVRTGRRKSDAPGAEPPAERKPGLFGTGPTTSAIPALDAAATTSGTTSSTTSTTSSRPGGGSGAHPVTGPIPVQRASDPAPEPEEPLTGRESVLAWVRFAGELVLALAVGIGLYFAFTVLWELMPYVALVAAPAAVTALVAGVAAYRQRRGQGDLGVRLLAVLLLAGTVLVIAPAAGLLAG